VLKVFGREKVTPLDVQIERILDEMSSIDVSDEEYPQLITRLEQLYKLKDKQRPSRVSRDTLWTVAGNLFGILLIVAFERTHVMTSKGFNQIIRPRSQ
jgi:hypothetical protein